MVEKHWLFGLRVDGDDDGGCNGCVSSETYLWETTLRVSGSFLLFGPKNRLCLYH